MSLTYDAHYDQLDNCDQRSRRDTIPRWTFRCLLKRVIRSLNQIIEWRGKHFKSSCCEMPPASARDQYQAQ